MHLNQKGQAFSVFKLLIAAIVAVVILGILLSILNIIPGIGSNNPNKEAGDLLKNIAVNTSSVRVSQEVTFNADNDNINARAVAQAANFVVQTDQVCVFAGQFTDASVNPFTEDDTDTGRSITYTGTASAVNAAIKGMCDRGTFYEDADFEVFITDQEVVTEVQNGRCGCIGEPGQCCILLLERR